MIPILPILIHHILLIVPSQAFPNMRRQTWVGFRPSWRTSLAINVGHVGLGKIPQICPPRSLHDVGDTPIQVDSPPRTHLRRQRLCLKHYCADSGVFKVRWLHMLTRVMARSLILFFTM